MLSQLAKLLSDDGKNGLSINCGTAYILSDREGFLEKFDSVSINCGELLASSKAYANLLGKNASINCGESTIREINSEIITLESGAEVTEEMDFAGKFVVSGGDCIIRGEGSRAFAKAEGAHFGGTLFYPKDRGAAFLSNITGKKQPYPEDAHLVFGDKKLDELLFNISDGKAFIWVHGEITALEESALQKAKEKGLRYECRSLFTIQSFDEKYSGLFDAGERTLIPDGYEVTPDLTLTAGEAALYGPCIYVRGDLFMEKKHADCLSELESIIVKGTATIPSSCAKAFRAVGKADEYELVEDDVGDIMKVNGLQAIGHDYLQSIIQKGETIRIKVNGMLLFDENVTAGDMDAIAYINVNGVVILPDAAQGALSPKVDKVNGAINSIEALTKLTGMTLPEILGKFQSGGGGTSINTGFYMLV